MSTRQWMPLYIADYIADTVHLNAAQHGAYLLLIMHYWRAGELPTDEKKLAKLACLSPHSWNANREVLAGFFEEGWKHKRIEKELKKFQKISAERSANGSKGGTANALKNHNV